MKEPQKQTHIIDSLFPIVLFFVFTISAVIVILLATRIYESTTANSSRNNVSRTALTYVCEKIHQNDSGTQISITTLDGAPALKLFHTGDKEGYTTYIYYHDGSLKELFIKNGITPETSTGSFIAKVAGFEIEEVKSNLLRFTCTDEQGHTTSILVGLHSFIER